MNDPESVEETRRWLRFAHEDLTVAQRILADPSTAPRLACLLAQQAAEKAIKAALVFLQKEFPYCHDLMELRALLPADWDIKTGYEYLGDLSVWILEGRYPGDWAEATEAQAKLAVEQAGTVVDSITQDLRARGLTLEAE